MLNFVMPRWRFDILHPVDLVEEIAIGHGYEDLGQDVAKAPLTAIHALMATLEEELDSLCRVLD